MNKHPILMLAFAVLNSLVAFSQENRSNEVTVEFLVECQANGELDAEKGTTVTMEVTKNDGEVITLTYTFPQGSHARAITKYFADALKAKGFQVDKPKHNDGARKSSLTIRNVKSVKVGTSLNGKLPVTFSTPPPPPTRRPDTLPPPVITGKLPELPKPTLPPTPATAKPHRGPTTAPPHGPGSIQILITQGSSSGGQGGETTDDVTISISATQGVIKFQHKHKFPKKTTATAITKYFHEKLAEAGFDLKPYEEGDSQLFFNRVCKLDGSYSELSAKTTFGWGTVPVVIDDRKKIFKNYSIGLHYNRSQPNMEALNDYFDWINTTWSGDIAHLNTLQGGSAEFTYMFSPHFGLGAGYRLLTGSSSGTSIGGDFYTEVTSQGGYLLARGEWAPGRFIIGADCSAGYFGALYSETEEQLKQTGRDESMEFGAEIRLGFKLTDYVYLVAGGGYKALKFDDLGIKWYSPGEPPAVLDQSGLSMRVGMEFKF